MKYLILLVFLYSTTLALGQSKEFTTSGRLILGTHIERTASLSSGDIDNDGDNDIILATSNGYANRFHETDARSMGRNSQGVRGISLRGNDEVVAMVVVKREGTLLAISANGYGKRSEISNYKVTKRGSKGVITLKTTDRNGRLIALLEVVDNDDLMIVTKDGMIIRQAVDKISVIGRNTQGVKLIELNKKDKVFDIARIIADDEEEEIPEENNLEPTENGEAEASAEVTDTAEIEESSSEEVTVEKEESIPEEDDSTENSSIEEDTEIDENVTSDEEEKKKAEELELDFGLDD